MIVGSITLNSCVGNLVYSEHQEIPHTGWDKDSILSFYVSGMEDNTPYEVVLNVRHAENYPFQNLWLFVEKQSSMQSYKDTLEVYLADDRGLWLGNHKNGLVEMPILLEQGSRMSTDTIIYRIQQGMRADQLKGVMNVGISIKK